MKYRVPYADTDQMGIVYYANYFIYFERLRNELLRQTGLPYTEIEKKGIQLPVLEAVCKYKNAAKYDDLLNVVGWIEEINGVRIKMACEVYRDDELLVTGHTVHAFINDKGRPVRPQEDVLSFLIEK
jgi:acyl-CoA thioester hydrolase